jgi:Ricin-type beta-trefoil lectin domain-like
MRKQFTRQCGLWGVLAVAAMTPLAQPTMAWAGPSTTGNGPATKGAATATTDIPAAAVQPSTSRSLGPRASAAAAVDPVWGYRNQATKRCLDDTPEGGFRIYACNGSNPQKWRVHTWRDGTVRFQNLRTGKCMDDSNLGFRTFACNSTKFQSWYVKYWNDGTRRFQNQATKQCIDDSQDFALRTFSCNTTKWQSWYRR